MARKKRRTYSLEYKLETVALVLERGLSPRQVANDLGIDRSTVGVWVRKAAAGELAAPGGGSKTQEQLTAENKKLRRENKILREDRAILKKRRRSLRAMSSSSLPVHRGGERQPRRSHAVSGVEGLALGVLHLA